MLVFVKKQIFIEDNIEKKKIPTTHLIILFLMEGEVL